MARTPGKEARPARPLKRRTVWLLRVAIVVVLGFLPTCATMAIFPVGTRIAAPLVCPSGTEHSVVVARWGAGSKGGSSLKWNLYCLTAEGHGTIPSTPKIVFGLLVVWGGVVTVLLFLLRLRVWLTMRGRRGGDAHAS